MESPTFIQFLLGYDDECQISKRRYYLAARVVLLSSCPVLKPFLGENLSRQNGAKNGGLEEMGA